MRYQLTLFMIANLVASAIIMLPTPASADYVGIHTTDCPSANLSVAFYSYNYWRAQYRSTSTGYSSPGTDFGYLYNPSTYQYLCTGDFTKDFYSGGWSEQELPPSNVTIQWVNVYLRVAKYGADSKIFEVRYALEESFYNVSHQTATWSTSHVESYISSDTSWTTISWNVTTLETWTATMLTANTTWLRIKSDDYGSTKLYVEYLGFRYAWYYPEAPPEPGEEGEEEGSWSWWNTGSSLAFGLGAAGFCGMIALPPVAVWMWRREGGDKFRAFLGLVSAFMVCFAMFLGSLG